MKKFELKRNVNISIKDLTWRIIDISTWMAIRLAQKLVRDSIDISFLNSIRNSVLKNIQKINLKKE